MKPFNLEEAKAGKPLITRDGRAAFITARVPEAEERSRLVVFVAGNSSPTFYSDGGVYTGGWAGTGTAAADLFMAPVKRVVWVVAAKRPFATGHRCAWTYENEDDALAQINRCNLYTGPYRLEIEE